MKLKTKTKSHNKNKQTRAAIRNISSSICRIRNRIAAIPTPGNIYELLPCPGLYNFPLYSTFPNGLPLANSTLPWKKLCQYINN